jgi:hypothetical protein
MVLEISSLSHSPHCAKFLGPPGDPKGPPAISDNPHQSWPKNDTLILPTFS